MTSQLSSAFPPFSPFPVPHVPSPLPFFFKLPPYFPFSFWGFPFPPPLHLPFVGEENSATKVPPPLSPVLSLPSRMLVSPQSEYYMEPDIPFCAFFLSLP